jgi:hypothetical protein
MGTAGAVIGLWKRAAEAIAAVAAKWQLTDITAGHMRGGTMALGQTPVVPLLPEITDRKPGIRIPALLTPNLRTAVVADIRAVVADVQAVVADAPAAAKTTSNLTSVETGSGVNNARRSIPAPPFSIVHRDRILSSRIN